MMTKIRSTDSSRIQDRRTPAQRAQSRTKQNNPNLYPKSDAWPTPNKPRPGPRPRPSRSYTPGGAKGGGGIWRDRDGNIIRTSKSEDAPISRTKPITPPKKAAPRPTTRGKLRP